MNTEPIFVAEKSELFLLPPPGKRSYAFCSFGDEINKYEYQVTYYSLHNDEDKFIRSVETTNLVSPLLHGAPNDWPLIMELNLFEFEDFRKDAYSTIL
jgi:hypothetical protein